MSAPYIFAALSGAGAGNSFPAWMLVQLFAVVCITFIVLGWLERRQA